MVLMRKVLHIASIDFCHAIAKGGARAPCAPPLATLLTYLKISKMILRHLKTRANSDVVIILLGIVDPKSMIRILPERKIF